MDRMEEFKGMQAAGKKQTRLDAENKWLKNQLKLITKQLEDTRESRGLELPERTTRRATPKIFARLCIPDTHGHHIHKPSFEAMLSDIMPRQGIASDSTFYNTTSQKRTDNNNRPTGKNSVQGAGTAKTKVANTSCNKNIPGPENSSK